MSVARGPAAKERDPPSLGSFGGTSRSGTQQGMARWATSSSGCRASGRLRAATLSHREAELFDDPGAESLDGLETDVEFVRNLPGAQGTTQELKHFQFAVAESFDHRTCRRGVPSSNLSATRVAIFSLR